MASRQASFPTLLQEWCDAACTEVGYPSADATSLPGVTKRLPAGLRTLIEQGHDRGLITSSGLRFTLAGLPAGKGPYQWLGRDSARQAPAVLWEYFVQAAEYVRISQQLAALGYQVLVEDRLMDITVTRDDQLLWYVEVKERADDLPEFTAKIATHGQVGVDLTASSRGDDALPKAQYLMRYRPRFFSVTAIGLTVHFRTEYDGSSHFTLAPDLVPLP